MVELGALVLTLHLLMAVAVLLDHFMELAALAAHLLVGRAVLLVEVDLAPEGLAALKPEEVSQSQVAAALALLADPLRLVAAALAVEAL